MVSETRIRRFIPKPFMVTVGLGRCVITIKALFSPVQPPGI